MPNSIKSLTVYGEHGRTIIFEVSGVVLEGKKKGKELGFPTANLSCDNSIYGERSRTISGGIYAGEAIWKETVYQAAIYKDDTKNIVEAHLLNFSGNLYGETITIIAYQKIRDGKLFPNREELIAAIAKDIQNIKKLK